MVRLRIAVDNYIYLNLLRESCVYNWYRQKSGFVCVREPLSLIYAFND